MKEESTDAAPLSPSGPADPSNETHTKKVCIVGCVVGIRREEGQHLAVPTPRWLPFTLCDVRGIRPSRAVP